MKLSVIVTDASHYANVGGEIERIARTFDLPAEIAEYIEDARRNQWASISLALVDEQRTTAREGE